MKKYYSLVILGVITILAYLPIFVNKIPFPGDLLVAEFKPWSTYSYLGYVPGSYPTKGQYFDVIRQLYPWRILGISALKSFEIPLWNPYNFTGTPLLANLQSALLYPLNILFFFFTDSYAWSLLIICQTALALFGMYKLTRKLNFNPIASIVTSISYAFNGQITTILEYNTMGHIIALLPWSLWCGESYFETKKSRYLIILSFIITFSFFAGHLQYFAANLLVLFLYFVWKGKQFNYQMKILLPILITLLLGISMTAIQMFPTLELIHYSSRVSHSKSYLDEKLLLQPMQLDQFFFPDMYGNPSTKSFKLEDTYATNAIWIGSISSIFLFLSFFLSLKKSNHLAFYRLIFIMALLFTVRSPISEYLYSLPIPFLSGSSPSNFLYLLCFSGSLLAGFGLTHYTSNQLTIKKAVLLLSCISFVLCIQIIFKYPLYLSGIVLGSFFLLLSMAVIFSMNRFSSQFIKLSMLSILLLELLYYHYKYNPFSPNDLTYPTHPLDKLLHEKVLSGRYWGYGTANTSANTNILNKLRQVDGYDPLYPIWFGQLINASKNENFDHFDSTNRSDATIQPGFGSTDLVDNKNRLRLLTITGVTHILDRPDNGATELTFPPSLFSFDGQIDNWRLYKYSNSLPRVQRISKYTVINNNQQLFSEIFTPSFTPDKMVVVSTKLNFPSYDTPAQGTAAITSESLNQVMIETSGDSTAILSSTELDYPGWVAYVNKNQIPITRTNGVFRSVEVPEGNSSVRFIYQPNSFYFGSIISGITLVTLLFYAVKNRSSV